MKKRSGFLATLIVAVLAIVAIGYQRDIRDWLILRGYDPPAEVVQLADSTTLVDSSRRLFYINKPVIASNEVFNEHCRDNEYSIVLGCYLPGQRGIYLLDVDDERLIGIKEVTAAHELLHAVYERLSSGERANVDAMLQSAFDQLSNTRVKETIELYRKQDPSVVPNEMHSILGTEVRSLPEELEQYYSRYFNNRLVIVGLSEQYEQAFIDRRNAIRDYDIQLSDLKSQIEPLSSRLMATDNELKQARSQMNSLRASGQSEQYNSMVPGYNSKVNSYNRDVDRLRAMVAQYNSMVQQRNDIAAEEAELVDAIDSRDVVPEQR